MITAIHGLLGGPLWVLPQVKAEGLPLPDKFLPSQAIEIHQIMFAKSYFGKVAIPLGNEAESIR